MIFFSVFYPPSWQPNKFPFTSSATRPLLKQLKLKGDLLAFSSTAESRDCRRTGRAEGRLDLREAAALWENSVAVHGRSGNESWVDAVHVNSANLVPRWWCACPENSFYMMLSRIFETCLWADALHVYWRSSLSIMCFQIQTMVCAGFWLKKLSCFACCISVAVQCCEFSFRNLFVLVESGNLLRGLPGLWHALLHFHRLNRMKGAQHASI